jgi:3-methyladenine DNA glycosylase Tag
MADVSNSPCRCGWVHDDPIEIAYHDQEWGVPLHNDRKHFEFIILDGFPGGAKLDYHSAQT